MMGRKGRKYPVSILKGEGGVKAIGRGDRLIEPGERIRVWSDLLRGSEKGGESRG